MNVRSLLVGLLLGAAIATAATAGAASARRYFNAPGKSPDLPFSDGVLVGDTLYLAGKLGIDPKTGKVPAAVEDEARLALESLQATLKQAGMSMDDLVQVQVYCSDVALFDSWNKVYRTFFKKELPARAFLGSGKLLREARFEIMGIAARR
jgi:2-iminobutanoate/2-iminopropanoate deaminase